MKIRAELDLKALEVRLSHLVEEAGAQYSRVKDLQKSNLDMRAKFCRAKEQLRKYKEKARSFYRQLNFASWARDSGFSMGYMRGIETFRAWVRKPGNFSKVSTISIEELLPLKGIAEDAETIGQKKMPDCRGIKHMGFEPYLIYNLEARAEVKLPPRVEHPVDLDIESTGSMGSSVESWDCVPNENPNSQYL